MPRSFLRRPGAVLLWTAVLCSAHAGLLDALHIRAKADAPLEADQPGYEVLLLDSHSEQLLVSGRVSVPDSFGKVDLAGLEIRAADGQKVGEVMLAPAIPPSKTPAFEFNLRREYLKNSTVTVTHDSKETLDVVVFDLGTFGVRDFQSKNGPLPPPRFRVVLAEQGVFGEENHDFTMTDQVPLTEGQPFGFRLYVRGGGGSLPARIEQTLPRPPKTWGDEEMLKHLKISEDGRTAVSSDRMPTEQLIEQSWTIAEGDPPGNYEFKIFLRDELVKTFVFHVQPPSPAPTENPTDTK